MATEQPQEVTFTLRIKTYGKRAQVTREVGDTLVSLLRLNFEDAELYYGKKLIRYHDRLDVQGEA